MNHTNSRYGNVLVVVLTLGILSASQPAQAGQVGLSSPESGTLTFANGSDRVWAEFEPIPQVAGNLEGTSTVLMHFTTFSAKPLHHAIRFTPKTANQLGINYQEATLYGLDNPGDKLNVGLSGYSYYDENGKLVWGNGKNTDDGWYKITTSPVTEFKYKIATYLDHPAGKNKDVRPGRFEVSIDVANWYP